MNGNFRLSTTCLRIGGALLLTAAVMLLWGALAAVAATFLTYLPDMWAEHIEDAGVGARYTAIALVTFGAFAGILCLAFVASACQSMADFVVTAREGVREVRAVIAHRAYQRLQTQLV